MRDLCEPEFSGGAKTWTIHLSRSWQTPTAPRCLAENCKALSSGKFSHAMFQRVLKGSLRSDHMARDVNTETLSLASPLAASFLP